MPIVESIVILLGKQGHGTILTTQYLPLIAKRPVTRNVGNFIFLGTHESNNLARIQEIIRPYSKYADLIPALGRGMGMLYPLFPSAAVLREVQKAAKKLPLHCSMNTRSTYSDGLDVVGLLNVVEALI